ncbi:MAG: hypothetical protein ACI9J2_001400 [Saprospiraceae bacterium]|jgi:hypothetical protein
MFIRQLVSAFALCCLTIAVKADDATPHNVIRDALSYGKTLTNLGPRGNTTYNFSKQYRPTSPLSNFTEAPPAVTPRNAYTPTLALQA